MNEDKFKIKFNVGDTVIPSENWGSNSFLIKEGVIVDILTNPSEYVVSYIDDLAVKKQLVVYPYEVEIKMKKQNGKTTKIIDRCVQQLFSKGFCYLYDESRVKSKTMIASEKMRARLQLEHKKVKYKVVHKEFNGIFCALFTLNE